MVVAASATTSRPTREEGSGEEETMKPHVGLVVLAANVLFSGGAAAQTIQQVSVVSGGGYVADSGVPQCAVSEDGRYTAFCSTRLLDPRAAGFGVFVHDRVTGVTELVSVGPNGEIGDTG